MLSSIQICLIHYVLKKIVNKKTKLKGGPRGLLKGRRIRERVENVRKGHRSKCAIPLSSIGASTLTPTTIIFLRTRYAIPTLPTQDCPGWQTPLLQSRYILLLHPQHLFFFLDCYNDSNGDTG